MPSLRHWEVAVNGQHLVVSVPDALVDAIADRVLERLAERGDLNHRVDGWLRGAASIAGYLGCPPSRVYALSSAGRLPCVQRDGSALIASRGDLDRFMRSGGAKRP
jgi:hypothetical protein